MPLPMFDNPEDEMNNPKHSEPDGDESYIDDIMSQDVTNPEDKEGLFSESPLQAALTDAGYKVSPEQLTQIESILKSPAAAPGKPGAPAPMLGKPGMPKPGGAVPGNMGTSDLPMR